MITDSHAHFDTFAEQGELEAVLQRAAAAGVRRMLAIGGHPAANELAVRLATDHPDGLRAAVGYDRDQMDQNPPLDKLRPWLEQPAVVAVGETGLDYHYEPDSAAAQQRLFEQMLDLACEHKRPVVVHSREAESDTLAMLRKQVDRWPGDPERVAVLHCFTGTPEFARQLSDLGIYISFSGILTFKNADSLRDAAARVPADRLLVETDAPYLAPVPHRGRGNEPAYVVEVVKALAKIRNDTVERIADITNRNAARLFGWPLAPA